MKRLVWILLVIGVAAQPMGSTGAFLLFQANRAYISKYLCEQHQVAGSDCQGSCYLKRELQKEAEREGQLPQRNRYTLQTAALPVPFFQLQGIGFKAENQKQAAPYILEVYASPEFPFFHPPQNHGLVA